MKTHFRILLILISVLCLSLLLSACTGTKDDSGKPSAGTEPKFTQEETSAQPNNQSDATSPKPTDQDSSPAPSQSSSESKPEESSAASSSSQESSTEASKPDSSQPEQSQTESSQPEQSQAESSKPEESSKESDLPAWLENATDSQRAAYYSAYERYANSFYSYQGLIDALYYQDDFDYDDAEWAVDHLDANFYSDALGYANYQLKNTGYSPYSLRDSLEIAGFTDDEADYAMENCNADWPEEAAEVAWLYADQVPGSRNDILDYLTNVGFSYDDAAYGVTNSGIDWYTMALRIANNYVYLYAPVPEYGVKMQLMDYSWENDEIEYALANVDADFDEMALERAYEIVGDYSISLAYLEYALMNEQYMQENIDYVDANIEINWSLEAVGAAWLYLDDFPDCSHEELWTHLTAEEWFTGDEADYACSYVGK